MELGVDRAVDDPGLEAGVRIAEKYRRGHGIVAAVYASVVVFVAKRQLDRSLAVLGSCLAEMQGCRLEPAPSMSLIIDLPAASLMFNTCIDSRSIWLNFLVRHDPIMGKDKVIRLGKCSTLPTQDTVLIYQISRQPIHASPKKRHGTKCSRLGKPQVCEYRTHRATGAPLRPGSNHVGR